MSAWEYYNGAFDYTATPLGPIGCKIMIHNTSNKRKSWYQIVREGFSVVPDLQNYRCIIQEKIMKYWGAKYQLVPPNVHRQNIAERAIRIFKAHFLEILAGVDPDFPKYMWDNLLVQTESTMKLLRQATLNPRMPAWEYYNGAFDYNATPLGPQSCKIMIHNTSNKRKSWD